MDPAQELVYFSGNQGNHTEKHLFVASFATNTAAATSSSAPSTAPPSSSSASSASVSSGVRRLTADSGWHTTAVCAAAGVFVDVFSSVDRPPVTRLYRLPTLSSSALLSGSEGGAQDGRWPVLLAVLSDAAESDPRLSALLPALPAPRLDRVPLPTDAALPLTGEAGGLQCALYLPDRARFGPGPYPTVVSVYGGPGPQRVSNTWLMRVDLRAQRLAQDGYLGE